MKNTIKLLLLIILIQNSSGCAHFFSSANTEHFSEEVRPLSICIGEGDVSVVEGSSRTTSKVRSDTKSKLLNKIQEKYPSIVIDCNASDKYVFLLREEQERVKGDYFFLSLGIIPLIAETKFEVQVLNNEKSVYKATDSGKVVMSVFFTPFFFLHKSNTDMLFNLLDTFLKKQSAVKNQANIP